MSLLDNQTFRKKIEFGKIDDNDKKVSISFNVTCNHEIPKDILTNIENNINDLFFKDYESLETIQAKQQMDKEIEKSKKQLEKMKEKNEKKQQEQQSIDNKKRELDYQNQFKSKKPPVMYNKSGFN